MACLPWSDTFKDASTSTSARATAMRGANVPFVNLQLFNKHLTKNQHLEPRIKPELWRTSVFWGIYHFFEWDSNWVSKVIWKKKRSSRYHFFPFFAQRFEVDVLRVSPQFHLCLTWSRSSRVTARISCRRRSWHKSPPGRKSSAESKFRWRQVTKSKNTS